MNFIDRKGDKKIKFFSQVTYMARNFISKTSTVLYSLTKIISKIYQLEREYWLPEVLQKLHSSIIYSFIFIHSVMSENDKNVLLIVCDFHTK